MALPTDALATYAAIGRRESLEDEIYLVDPIDTPLLSSVAHITGEATLIEWQTQALAAADGANAVLEGDDGTTTARTVTVRESNTLQISDKISYVSGTQQAVVSAGRSDELSYQVGLDKLALKRDLETILLRNQQEATGDSTTARTLGALPSWLTSNVSRGVGGSNGSRGNTTATDGTARALTETMFKTVERSIWDNGGKPDLIMLGSFNKGVFSAFSGNATRMKSAEDKTLVATIDMWDGDFAKAKVLPNRFQRARELWLLEQRMLAVAFLRGRNMVTQDLSKTGDSDRRQSLSEYTLIVRNQQALGVVADLTVS